MSTREVEEELMAIIAASLPPARRARVTRTATLREVGLDSLTLMIVVGQFLERHPIPTTEIERLLPEMRTVGDLLNAGVTALELAGHVSANAHA
jgi:hypothetical protein